MPKLLISYMLPEPNIQSLAQHFTLIHPTKSPSFTQEEILHQVAEADAYLAVNHTVDRQTIERGKKLKIIANYGVGYDGIDVAYASERGITVTNTPTAVTEATAEVAFGLMLSLMRNIAFCDRQLRYNREEFVWGMLQAHTGHSLYGKTLGLIGLGRIGQAVARRASIFGMNVLYYQRSPLFDPLTREFGATYRPLDDLLQASDVISLHVPLNDSTHHLLGARELALIRPEAFLINTSRGPVIDEQALIAQLEEGKLAGAALDVFEEEPHIPEALLRMDKVVLTPHIGTETIEARIAMGYEAERNLVAFFAGEIPPNTVT